MNGHGNSDCTYISCLHYCYLLSSHLNNRKQYTVISDYQSKLQTVTCGVPQGSVLGPLLFLIYVNDIQSAVSSATAKLFADDTNLFFHCKHPEELYTIANTSMVQFV